MKTKSNLSDKVIELIKKGVDIPNPFSIDIGDEINLDRISSAGVKLYPGTRIYGAKTLVSQGTKLGYEAPATIVDCQIGPHVELKGGFFKSSVFLEKANVAFGAQVREGCILEEEANANHTVGLKQTILFPFVTLGSLINFCDCLMAGGTSRKNHSEVGSSYIHPTAYFSGRPGRPGWPCQDRLWYRDCCGNSLPEGLYRDGEACCRKRNYSQ